MPIFGRFTERTQRVLNAAGREAAEVGTNISARSTCSWACFLKMTGCRRKSSSISRMTRQRICFPRCISKARN